MNVSFRFLSILFECILFYTTGRLWLVGCKLQKNQLAPIFPTHKNCLSNHVSYSIVIVLILCLKLIWRSYMVCEICVCLDRNYPAFSIPTFPSFFFSCDFWLLHPCTVYDIVHTLFMEPTTILFRKKILKMGHMALFTYLKIIFLQRFQFSVVNKINYIQTDPNVFFPAC